jgi:hypothetical protein
VFFKLCTTDTCVVKYENWREVVDLELADSLQLYIFPLKIRDLFIEWKMSLPVHQTYWLQPWSQWHL